MNRNLFYLFLVILASCTEREKNSPNVFFAGEIVNPTSKKVFLSKDDKVLDSVRLDENSRFSFNLPSIEEGLYHFNHGNEYQYIYLGKGDSIQIRLNTMDFDESLVFSGKGSEINNFLLDFFLANEEEELLILSTYFQMNPLEFDKKIEELRTEKLALLSQLQSEAELSKGEQEIAEVIINYTYYNYKEKFPFEHRKRTGEKLISEMPNNFYAYRKDVNFDNENLTYLTPYYNFAKSHLKNLSYIGCEKKCGIENEEVISQLHFNRHKLSLIDSLIREKDLKDNLFRNVAMEYLLRGGDTEENNEIFINDFHLRSQNNKHLGEINELYEGIRNMQPQKKIPNLLVKDFDGNNISLQEIAKDKKVAFYFWSVNSKRYFKDVVKRVSELSKTNKDYLFVGINYKTDDITWRGMVSNSKLDKSSQYKADDFKELTKTLIFNKRNKCIITDDATIVDGFTTMWAANF